MRRRKPVSWDGQSRMCTSPYPVKKGGCLGEVDYGQGIQIAVPGAAEHRYCIPCHSRQCREIDEAWEKKQAAAEKAAAKSSTPVEPEPSRPSDSKKIESSVPVGSPS